MAGLPLDDEVGAGAAAVGDDPHLAAVLEPIGHIEPPDPWPQIVAGVSTARPWGGGSAAWWRRFRAGGVGPSVAAAVVLLGIVLAGILWLARPQPVDVTADPSGQGGRVPDAPAGQGNDGSGPGRAGRPTGRGGARSQAIEPSFVDEGTAVYDLALDDGSRFRVAVPVALSPWLTEVVPQRPPAPVFLTGPGVTFMRIGFGVCSTTGVIRPGANGSLIEQTGPGAGGTTTFNVCRPDELLSTEVATAVQLDADEVALLDVRPVRIGTGYRETLARFLGFDVCPGCSGAGPIPFGDVVVNATGSTAVAAVDTEDLSERWQLDPGLGDLRLLDPSVAVYEHDPSEGVWVATSAGVVLNLDPASGEENFRIWIGEERVGGLTGVQTGPWLLWSSHISVGDTRPPTLRRIDPAAGGVLWTASGRAGADWASNPIARSDRQVFIVDVFDDPDSVPSGRGSVVWAFDLDTGDLDFTVDLDAPAGASTPLPLLQVVEVDGREAVLAMTSHGLLTRIDPATGSALWTSRINPGVLRGVVELADGTWAVRVQATPPDPYLLDAATGQRLVEPTAADDPDG